MSPDAGIAATAGTPEAGPTAVNRDQGLRSRLLREGPGLLLLAGWLAYTRLYFVLHPLGLTFDPSLFMRLTGHPDPACGLTRTFAWMWRGDVLAALRAYPLGPLLFVLAFAQIGDSLVALFTGWRIPLTRLRLYLQPLIVLAVAAVAINWMLKWVWLGM